MCEVKKSDMAAAKMLGRQYINHTQLCNAYRKRGGICHCTTISHFSLCKSSDRDDIIEMLGERHSYGICATDSEPTRWFVWDENKRCHVNDILELDRVQAIRKAVMYVDGNV